jgi:hypothetical protein
MRWMNGEIINLVCQTYIRWKPAFLELLATLIIIVTALCERHGGSKILLSINPPAELRKIQPHALQYIALVGLVVGAIYVIIHITEPSPWSSGTAVVE